MSSQALAEQSAGALAQRTPQFDLSPRTLDEALRFSDYLAASDMVPKDFKGKAGNCLVAIQWGMEIGLKPLQAMQNIAVINGRPSLWGDAVIALVRSSPLCEYVIETDDGNVATCRVKRRGEPEQVRTFSMDDAKAAGLMSKEGPWKNYPKRMRQMRARAFAVRDVFPDVLKGMPVAEEVLDIPSEPKFMGPAEVLQQTTQQQPALPPYDQAKFEHNLKGAWAKRVADGGNPDDLLAMLKTRNTLTAEQEAAIKAIKPATPAAEPWTFERVKQRLEEASDVDALYIAADLISAVPDETQRAELNTLFDQLNTKMKGQ
ncbi:MAG: hypothetical protein ACOY95_03310 [Pseudomonadota bacterium]